MKYKKAKEVMKKHFKDAGMNIEFSGWFPIFGRKIVKNWAQEAIDSENEEKQIENQMQEE